MHSFDAAISRALRLSRRQRFLHENFGRGALRRRVIENQLWFEVLQEQARSAIGGTSD